MRPSSAPLLASLRRSNAYWRHLRVHLHKLSHSPQWPTYIMVKCSRVDFFTIEWWALFHVISGRIMHTDDPLCPSVKDGIRQQVQFCEKRGFHCLTMKISLFTLVDLLSFIFTRHHWFTCVWIYITRWAWGKNISSCPLNATLHLKRYFNQEACTALQLSLSINIL